MDFIVELAELSLKEIFISFYGWFDCHILQTNIYEELHSKTLFLVFNPNY